MRNFAKFTRKNLCQNLFLIKLNSVDLQFIKKKTLAEVFPCEFYKICKNAFFAEHHRTTNSIIAVSIVAKGKLANETVNYDTKTKAQVPI